jgi:hypothetical protein
MSQPKKKPYTKAAIFGLLSVGSYVGLFMNKTLVMDYFTRGGKYAALVIVTAFYFSFIHGAFCSNALDILGLEAAKKK